MHEFQTGEMEVRNPMFSDDQTTPKANGKWKKWRDNTKQDLSKKEKWMHKDEGKEAKGGIITKSTTNLTPQITYPVHISGKTLNFTERRSQP